MPFDRITDSLTLDRAPDLSLAQDNHATALQIREIIQGLVDLGVNINPSSRLYKYAELFEEDHNAATLALDYALLESLQFLAILRALRTMHDSSAWLRIAESASCGHPVATEDQIDSRARSDQFELFTMACLTMAGFRTSPHEPDLRAEFGKEQVSFAAKRLRSISRLKRNLHDACHQIAKQGLAGFAVLDLSFVEHVRKPVYVSRLEHQQLLAAVLLDTVAVEHERVIFSAAERPHMLGVLLHASFICRSVQPVARFVSRRWLLCAARDSSPARRLAAALQILGVQPGRAGETRK